jgi:hypothetical protein
MELGVPGLLLAVWLVNALARHLRRQLGALERLSPQHARVAYGLVSFLVANAATFSVATQAYSDLFILLILGWCLGYLLAMPVLAASGDTTRRRRSRPVFRHSQTQPGMLPPHGAALGRNAGP